MKPGFDARSPVQAIRGRASGVARRRRTERRDRAIRRMVNVDGETYSEVARRFGLHRTTVMRIARTREHLVRREWIEHPDGDRPPTRQPGERRGKFWRLGRRFGERRSTVREPGVLQGRVSRLCVDCLAIVPAGRSECPSCESTDLVRRGTPSEALFERRIADTIRRIAVTAKGTLSGNPPWRQGGEGGRHELHESAF